MSLINDALKKAQRQRERDLDAIPMSAGGSGRRRGLSTQTIILIGAGALVLVSLSVVFTVYLTSSPSPTPIKPAPLALSLQKMGTAPAASNAAPTIVFPSTDKGAPATATTAPAIMAPSLASLPQPAASPSQALRKTTEQIQDMVDTFRVSGVRSSATGSKVLMNDHIVKLNEIVDRETGLKLIKIDDSSLTFVDARGTEYQKTF